MRERELTEFTNMCMLSDGKGRVLVQERVGTWPGCTFPGGHVERGESFTDSMIREFNEETGLTIRHPRLCGVKDWIQEDGGRYVVLCYRAEECSGEIRSSEEGEVMWVELDKLHELKLCSGMETMLRLFLEDDISEQWFVTSDGSWREILK